MRNQFRVIGMLIAATLMVSLCACGGSSGGSAAPAAPASSQPQESSKATEPVSESASSDAAPADGESLLKGMKIGFAQMENNGSWRVAETKSVQEEAARLGIDLVYTDAQSSTAKQVSDVEDMVAQGVKYILLAPREEEGLQPALEKAKAAGIPVILVDRAVSGEDYTTLIASDFIEEGQRAGKWLVEATGGKGNIVVLEGTTGASVTIDRQKGFEEAIAGTELKIIAQQTADFTLSEGQKVMENIIQAKGSEITAVYAHNDDMALGAIQALKAAGLQPGKDVIVVSVDGCKAALQAIIAGELGCTVQCSPFFGPIAFETVAKLEAGEEVPRFIKNEDMLFDKTNAEQYVDSAF